MTEQFIAQQKVAQLPGVSDQRAPIVVYADSHTSPEALLAYKELRDWGYGKTTILNGGLTGWQAKGLPTESGAAANEIVFIKKLAPGAIAPQEFIALQQSGDVVVIDVRSDQEAATGVISGALHVPLEQLEDRIAELPADKEVLIYCANGIRAEMAHQTLSAKGINNRFLNETVTVAKDGSYTI
jgi:rhodanese-related sulfurtransferase